MAGDHGYCQPRGINNIRNSHLFAPSVVAASLLLVKRCNCSQGESLILADLWC